MNYPNMDLSCSGFSQESFDSAKVNSVHTLFNIALNFVSQNIESIESLRDFPELIGSMIFKAVAKDGMFINNYPATMKVVEVFCSAYQDLILSSLCLARHLLIINKFLDPLLKLTLYLVELDLRSCHLGDDHIMIAHIGELKSLKKLCLKDNCLTNYGIRKLTLPLRMFDKGLLYLEELDISDNPDLTDMIIVWFSKLNNLRLLDLRGTSITDHGVLQICEKYKFVPSNDELSLIRTKGWATLLIEQWEDFCNKEMAKKKNTTFKHISTFYSHAMQKKNLTQLSLQPAFISNCSEFILKKNCSLGKRTYHENSVAEKCSSSNLVDKLKITEVPKQFKVIKEDLFSQYL